MIDESLFQSMVQIRRQIHQYPEIEFDVEKTAALVANELSQLGLEVRTGVGRTGVVADLNIPGATRSIAFRADMDALPIQEEGDLPYKSKIEGRAHLCGHDSHTAMLIGAARQIAKRKEQLKRNVRFIFQPSEEKRPGGAPGMIREGCLDGVDEIYALHVWPWLKTGDVGICPGPVMAQSDIFDITIEGRGGHAAAPHQNVDPIVVGSYLVSALQTLVSRTTDPLHPAVVSITQFHSGSAHNVIPSTAKLGGTVRTYHPEVLASLMARLTDLVEKCCDSFGAQGSLDYQEGYPPVINHDSGCEVVQRAAKKFLDEENVLFPAEKAMFGEDFAYYLQEVPGCFIQLGCRHEEKECVYPLHHPRFNLDEECMKVGARLFYELALDL